MARAMKTVYPKLQFRDYGGWAYTVITLPHTFRKCSLRRLHRLNVMSIIESAYAWNVDLWRSEFSSDVD